MVQETPLFPGTIARPALTLSRTPRYIPAVPTPDALRARVERALATVRNPRLERDVFSAGLGGGRSEEHTSELQSRPHLVCRLLLEKTTTSRQAFSYRLWSAPWGCPESEWVACKRVA